MATAAAPIHEPPPAETVAAPGDRRYRLSVEQYHEMIGVGILGPTDRVELVEGVLVKKMTKNERHTAAAKLADIALHRILPAGWHIAHDDPVVVQPHNEPEPDLSIVRGGPRDYLKHKPGPGDVALVIEIADSSLREDQSTMKVIYARAGIPFYWIANLPANRLEVYSDPTGPDPQPDYRTRTTHGPGDEVPLVLDGREVARVAVRDLLP